MSTTGTNTSLDFSRTLRSFLYHVNVANGLPAVAVHMSFSTVPATIVVLSSYPVTVSFAGGSTKFDKLDKSEPVRFFLSIYLMYFSRRPFTRLLLYQFFFYHLPAQLNKMYISIKSKNAQTNGRKICVINLF